jgi:hypothetical protein
MKKYLALISLTVLTVLLPACHNNNTIPDSNQQPVAHVDSTALPAIQADKLDSMVGIIIELSANDFVKNQQPAPVDFKNVSLKYIKKESGEELYILCGQFVTKDNQETQFATIKNSDYEQWIGNSALTYCQNSKEIPYTKEDLSVALKNKFRALKK